MAFWDIWGPRLQHCTLFRAILIYFILCISELRHNSRPAFIYLCDFIFYFFTQYRNLPKPASQRSGIWLEVCGIPTRYSLEATTLRHTHTHHTYTYTHLHTYI